MCNLFHLTSNQMGTDVDQAFQRWRQEELSDADDSNEITVSQMLDHGSISFGRFPIETLSWERRSVFTHNRCQEELEKFNGLVAKKKAYFEERYRRIRAMKANQNHQTELTLEYSGDVSISSQSGEEDGVGTKQEDFREYIFHSPVKEVKSEAKFEQEISCIEPLDEGCLNPEFTLSTLLRGNSSSGGQDMNSIRIEPLDEGCLNPEFTLSTLLRGNSSSGGQDINSIRTAMVQQLEAESSSSLIGGLDEIELHCGSKFESLDNKEVVQNQNNLVSDVKPQSVVVQGPAVVTDKMNNPELQAIAKSLDAESTSIVKDHAAVTNISRETKVNVVQSIKGLRTTSQKALSQIPYNTTINRVKSNTGSTLVALNRPLREACSNISIPGPFTLVMERRASSRGTAARLNPGNSSIPAPPRSHASSNIRAPPRSHAKDSLTTQQTMKKNAATNGVTRRGPEIKRDSKEVRSKPLAVNNQYTSLKKSEAHIFMPSKSRCVNLPARTKLTFNGGIECQPATVKEIKREENPVISKKGNVRTREFRRVATTTVPTISANTRMESTKPIAAQGAHASLSGRKLRLDNLSLDARCTRRETPKWR